MAPDAQSPDADGALLLRFAQGDTAAARVLTLRHGPRLIALARRMLGDAAEAEDVAQDTLLRLWRHAGSLEIKEAGAGPWLSRVATNLCLDRLRRRSRTTADPPDRADEAAPAVTGLTQAERARALHAALATLPDRQRAAIVLRHFEDFGNPAIAETLGVSVEAVESLLARGRRGLAAYLAPRKAELELDDGES